MKKFLTTACVVTLLASTSPSDSAEILINGYRLAPTSVPTEVRLEMLDDKSFNISILKVLKSKLENAGIRVSDKAGMTLSFDTRLDSTLNRSLGKRGIVSLKGTSTSSRGDSAQAEVSLYSNRDDSLLGGGRGPNTHGPEVARHELEFFLTDAQGARVWQGSAITEGEAFAGKALLVAMMRPLISQISLNTQSITVPLEE